VRAASAVTEFRPVPEWVYLLLASGAATLGGVAVLGSHSPLLFLVVPIAGAGFAYAARRPLLTVVLMVVVEVTNVSGVLSPRGGIPFFQASLALGLIAIFLALRDPVARNRLNAWPTICAGLLGIYIASQAVAAVGSVDSAQSFEGMHRYVLDCGFLMVVLILVQLSSRPWAVAGAVVIPLAVLSVLTVINELVYGGTVSFGGFSTVTTSSGELVTTLRYGGPLPDSNFWGRHLVMGLPLAAALLTRAIREGRRPLIALWVLTVLSQLAGIYMTQSRGTFLAAGTAIAVWFIASERSVRRWGLVQLPVALLLFLLPGVGNRLVAAFTDVSQAAVNANVDPSVLGRLAAQQQAWMMFGERPYFGFGPGTFPGEVINFAGRVPIAVIDPTIAPHNLYAELAACSGICGLVGWALMIAGFVTVAVLGIVANPKSRERVLAAAVIASIVAWSAASIALHLAYFRTFAILLALTVAVAPPWPVGSHIFRMFVRGVGVWLCAGILGLGVFWTVLSARTVPAFTAVQATTLTPAGPYDGWYAYALDIRSRREFLPTFAVILGSQGSEVQIDADPVRGILAFSATADSAGAARDRIQLAVGRAETVLHSSIGYTQYSVQPLGTMTISPASKHLPNAFMLSVGLGMATSLISGRLLFARYARRRSAGPSGSAEAGAASLERMNVGGGSGRPG